MPLATLLPFTKSARTPVTSARRLIAVRMSSAEVPLRNVRVSTPWLRLISSVYVAVIAVALNLSSAGLALVMTCRLIGTLSLVSKFAWLMRSEAIASVCTPLVR